MNSFNPLLGPVIALVLWTVIMLFVAVFRLVSGAKAAGKIEGLPANPRGRDFEGRLAEEHLASRRNYEHLVEQPTLFYAIVLALVAMGDDFTLNLWIAWAYVALRIGHSIAQSLGKSRGLWFVSSTVALLALTIHDGLHFIRHM
jgi:uncharacterized MAPEG superfamily protein